MAQAVRTILKADYDGNFDPINPWSIDNHLYGCEKAIWSDDGESLVDPRELKDPERPSCSACKHGWELWSKLLKLGEADDQNPPTFFGDMAYRGLRLENQVLTFGYPKIEDLDGFDYDLMLAAHTARKQFEIWLTIQRQKKADKG